MIFPTLGEYNKAISKYNGEVLNTIVGFDFVPSKTIPFKMYQYGSGTFAGVFKAKDNNNTFAIRCFIQSELETISRYKFISDYLSKLDTEWQVNFEFVNNEITIEGNTYPIISMEWIDGLLINDYVSKYIFNFEKLTELQESLIKLSNSLEVNKVGHGDLQSGNIIIQEVGSEIVLRLIDYDGMYVPSLSSKKNIEKGRPEFQHPLRKNIHYNHKIDRFSIWVMITAIEAVKLDSKLWNQVNEGGFNTLDNFLFDALDFIDPINSKLFKKLAIITSINFSVEPLRFYSNTLKEFCFSDFSKITKPKLIYKFKLDDYIVNNKKSKIVKDFQRINNTSQTVRNKISSFMVLSDVRAEVFDSKWVKIGMTPLEIFFDDLNSEYVYLKYNTDTRKIIINNRETSIKINFHTSEFKQGINLNPINQIKEENSSIKTNTINQNDTSIWPILIVVIFLLGSFVVVFSLPGNQGNAVEFEEAASVQDSAFAAVDSTATSTVDSAVFSTGKIIDSLVRDSNVGPRPADEAATLIDVDATESKTIFGFDQEKEDAVKKVSLDFLNFLGSGDCQSAFSKTYVPAWEKKGINWFCSVDAYGGVNKVSNIDILSIDMIDDKAYVSLSYYANDIYRGGSIYNQQFTLEQYNSNGTNVWLIIKIKNR